MFATTISLRDLLLSSAYDFAYVGAGLALSVWCFSRWLGTLPLGKQGQSEQQLYVRSSRFL